MPTSTTTLHPYSPEAILPLLERREQLGGEVRCTFLCPQTGTRAAAGVPAETPEGHEDAGLFEQLRSTLDGWMPDALSGALGRLRGVLPSFLTSAEKGPTFDPDVAARVLEATVRAFRCVSERFHWDPLLECWVGRAGSSSATPASCFHEQLGRWPPHGGDRDLLRRMLIEVARADGEPSVEEQEMLGDLFGEQVEIRPISDSHLRSKLTPVELEAAGPGEVRATLLMISWALALLGTDFDQGVSEAQLQRLEELGRGLELDESLRRSLERAARSFVFERRLATLSGAGHTGVDLISRGLTVADAIGLDPHLATRHMAVYRQLHPAPTA